jgi:hypothetical protein
LLARKTVLLLGFLCIGWFAVMAFGVMPDTGLADTGNYTRNMTLFASGPSGMLNDWPQGGTEDWSKRFFHYWIPHWKAKWDFLHRIKSSAVLLWLPGLALNALFYSRDTIYLPMLSLLHRAVLLASLLILIRWILRRERPLFFLLTLGVPATLLLSSADYLAYLNTLYEEGASLVTLIVFLLSLAGLRRHPTLWRLGFGFAALLALTTSKPQYVYWAFLGAPALIWIWSRAREERNTDGMVERVHANAAGGGVTFRPSMGAGKSAGLAAAAALSIAAFSAFATKAGSELANPYHRMFYGALSLSHHPAAHLQRMGMPEALPCVDQSYYATWGPISGADCHTRFRGGLAAGRFLSVVAHEPAIFGRMLIFAMDRMQDVSPDFLGLYRIGDPRDRSHMCPDTDPVKEFESRSARADGMPLAANLWSEMKFSLFPTGKGLLLCLAAFAIWFALVLGKWDPRQDFACIGLIAALACGADMITAALGDGKYDLIRHLFLANLLFDIALIAFVNSVAERAWQWMRHERASRIYPRSRKKEAI